MNTYMISILLPNELTTDFIALIPKQRKKIDQLMDEGKIIQYALSVDHSKLWITLSAESEAKARAIISSFPLAHFMKPTYFELAFQNSISSELPKLIMN